MLDFVTLAVKTQLNVHDLNNEAVAGNVTDIRIIEFLNENGERREAPAVSGRMLKHWHYEGIRHLIVKGSYSSVPLCAGCKTGEPMRPGIASGGKLAQINPQRLEEERNFITNCAICDIHGYLIALEGKTEQAQSEPEEGTKSKGKKKGVPIRRTSRAMFSWLMPVLGSESAQKQVLHTRVSRQQEIAEGESPAQMIFNKSYASGIYAFVSALDIKRIGAVELLLGSDQEYAVDQTQRKQRATIAIESYRLMISGQIGASLSHALPHQNPRAILVAYSENGPLPFPVSPMYPDYLNRTVGLFPKNAKFLYWGEENKLPENVKPVKTIDNIFVELISKLT